LSLSDGLKEIVTVLQSKGFRVYLQPIDKISEDIIFVDIIGIDKLKDCTGGYEIKVDLKLVLFIQDRIKTLDVIEDIVKSLDQDIVDFNGVTTSIFAENLLSEIHISYYGVIYLE